MKIITKHSGADWLRLQGIKNISPLGEQVADLVGHLFKGIYHISDEAMKANWDNPQHVKISIACELATWDYNNLTELVVLAHDACLRVSVRPYGPRNLLLLFHQRQREGGFSERHPTLESHAAMLREHYTVEPAEVTTLPLKE